MDIDKDVKAMPRVKKKGEKNLLVTVFKIVAVVVLFGIQVFVMLALYSTGKSIYNYARFVFEIIKVVTILYLLYRHDSAAYKISWILFIMFFPVVGVIAYFLWGNNRLKKNRRKEINSVQNKTEDMLKSSDSIIRELEPHKANLVNYASKITGYPIYKNEGVEFFEIGEKFFDSLKKDLCNAKKYILIEFFIFSKGKLWDEIFDILKKKSAEGVKVEIIYDSLGCLFRMPKNYKEELDDAGIEYYKFNPFTIFINGYMNYRDHRKIIAIDGKIAYTGGVNLADEYANIIERFGHWKDGGIKIKGMATWSFVLMFLRQKEQIIKKKVDYLWYKTDNEVNLQEGYVLPFADGPNNRKSPTENIYIQTINSATKYIYLNTPYFIPSEVLLNSILNAARSGVDVRVITPHIPDKKLVQIATRSYYEVLLEAGVKVYEYKPGFIHSKTLVADDDTAIVGSANLDFRSMHLNFECNAWIHNTCEELAIKEDFINMTKNKCISIGLEEWQNRPITQKWKEAIISAFSPML